jgi:hypothetical protein
MHCHRNDTSISSRSADTLGVRFVSCTCACTHSCSPACSYVALLFQRGCVHFGIHREYISWLRAHACVKRKSPSTYRRIPIHELHQSGLKHLQMTAQELTRFDGRAVEEGEDIEEEGETALPDTSPPIATSSETHSPSPSPSPAPTPSPPPQRFYPLRVAVNKKILEWVGDLTQPLLANTFEFMRFNFGGTDLTHSYTQVFFEPLYPIVASYKDMSLEHRAMIEDIFAEKVLHPRTEAREWKLVGFLSAEEQKESQQAGRAKLRQNRMGLVGVAADEEEPDFSSNMFLSLSMEDHSGASSTCFAFCCAGAQPFHAQRVREQQQVAAGKYGGSGSAAHPWTHQQALARRKDRIERKRRHSIGNVGLHQLHQPRQDTSKPTAASAATSSNVSAASSVAPNCSIAAPSCCSLPPSSASLAFRQRARSICNGVLDASRTPTRASACVSPRKRMNSADDLLVTSPAYDSGGIGLLSPLTSRV